MIRYVDRKSKAVCSEKIYGEKALRILYGRGPISLALCFLISYFPFVSRLYGYLMKRPSSRKKIEPFIREYGIDTTEFATHQFDSFNDFFIRKLKSNCRPIVAQGLAMPADGRYLVYPKFNRFFVKGQEFCLKELLRDGAYGRRFEEGSMAIARLCPIDYHRFHFPCAGLALEPRLINGHLYSVNPIALRKRIAILSENKRVITEIESDRFGTVLFIEVGATSVGSIRQTFAPKTHVEKGQEKGYFEFGGSCIILLFEKNRIRFDADLIENTERGLETYARYGESLGSAEQIGH